MHILGRTPKPFTTESMRTAPAHSYHGTHPLNQHQAVHTLYRPCACAAAARVWLSTVNSSWSCLDTPKRAARRSLLWPCGSDRHNTVRWTRIAVDVCVKLCDQLSLNAQKVMGGTESKQSPQGSP
jgi:hypothetical protein